MKTIQVFFSDESRKKNSTILIKCDQAIIEKAIIGRAEQKAVIDGESFFIVACCPRFNVTRDQQARMIDAGNDAFALILLHKGLPESALANP